MIRSRMWAWGRILAGVSAGVAGGAVFVVKCAKSYEDPEDIGRTKWNHNWDKREYSTGIKPPAGVEAEETSKKKEQPKACRYILLIRHGQYDMEKDKESQFLTELGRKQAEATGQRLKALGIKFSRLVTSNMPRAIETTDIIQRNLGQESLKLEGQDPMLREGSPVTPEPPVAGWSSDAHVFADSSRIEAAFRKYFHRASHDQKEDSYEIIVCHANVIRYFVCRALQIPPEAWLRISLTNGSLTVLSIRPSGRVTLRALGDSGHIPPELLTVS